jgi:hypothetical protein
LRAFKRFVGEKAAQALPSVIEQRLTTALWRVQSKATMPPHLVVVVVAVAAAVAIVAVVTEE